MLERLNEPENIKANDFSDMLGIVTAFPAQCREAVSLADNTDLETLKGKFSSVVVLGMGASGIGGDIVKALFETSLKIPIAVCKGYKLPAFIDAGALVIALSYSGETEETLTTFELAAERGAKVVAVTTGGRLAKRAAELGFPIIMVPGGIEPRAALGHLSLTAIIALEKLGLAEGARRDIDEMFEIIDVMSDQMGAPNPAGANIAKQLAGRLYGKMPVIFGSEGGPAVAALRWKCQMNENGKVPAFWSQFSELNHNEIVGWQELGEVSKDFCLVTLRSAGENARIQKRIEVTLPLIEQAVGESLQVWSEGESELARLYSLIYLGDLTSVYLAVLNEVDPTPVDKIMALKKALKEDS